MEEVAVEQKYVDFIENLIEQIHPSLPEDINKLQEDYLISNIRRSTMLLAKSMHEDNAFKSLEWDKQCTYIQIMAEWSFHKEIDLFRSGIPPKYWKVVMQKIWFVMWEVMYACIQNSAPDSVVLSVIERYVNRVYLDSVEELKATDVIDEAVEEKAKEQSNIDIMAREYLKQKKKQKLKKRIRYAVLLAIISFVVSFLVLAFKVYGVIVVLIALVLYNIIYKENKEE